ncbi:MAG TPA: sensor histidine kinase [Usitatibacter sp.]|nr:sensor histidine kinase [Usitatibacter sp.]
MKPLDKLAVELLEGRDAILVRWREQVRALPSAKKLDVPTLNDHIPGWIVELASTLRKEAEVLAPNDPGFVAAPLAHGLQRFEDGFDIEEVVAEYNILRDCVHDMAEGDEVDLKGKARRVVNRVFDNAIAAAVKAFAESQAREVQRRRAEHLAFVAHDLRTPLSAITFSAHILQQRLPERDDPETARLLKTLVRNAKQLDTLVANVLKENTHLLTELGVTMERRVFDLWPMVETLLQDMQPLAAKTSTRLVNQVPDDLDVRADAGLLRRILQNLIANAITYAPNGEVAIGALDRGPDQPVECWVTDNGAGIAPERLGKVFEALETDPNRGGIGLGLAIVKTFVEAHGGEVTVESVEGQGSTFRFTLPRAATVVAEAKKPVAAETGAG